MSKHFIFCHGFGFDKSCWGTLAPYFSKEQCTYLDLGYFGNKCDFVKNDNVPTIGIGHSLGFSKLLNLNIKFDYLIGLNSFINFLGNESNLHQKRELELTLLKKQFKKSPTTTMNNFYQTCGLSKKIEKINTQTAINDLNFLSQSFSIPHDIPVLIIGAKNDVIVPPEIIYDNFEKYSNVTIQILDQGKHGLGFFEAYEIREKIMNFITLI